MYTTEEYRGQLTLDDVQTLNQKKGKIQTAIEYDEFSDIHNAVWCNECRRTIKMIDKMIELRNNLDNSQFDIFNK